MQFITTHDGQAFFSAKEVAFSGLGTGGGLYVPKQFPKVYEPGIETDSLGELVIKIASKILGESAALKLICDSAFNFPIEVVRVVELQVAELFHGLTLAFKDFGARFLSFLFAHIFGEKVLLVTATSGDTGGAVASAFASNPDARVVVLYPRRGVTAFQERQIGSNGPSVLALAVDGTFDDCHALAKEWINTRPIVGDYRTISANSINFFRLLPQAICAAWLSLKLQKHGEDLDFIIPSANYGDLTGALMAKAMGFPIGRLVAASNANNAYQQYYLSGEVQPQMAKRTYSDAMDVGVPNNLPRLQNIAASLGLDRVDIPAFSFSDAETLECMERVYAGYGYVLDPHTAVGYLAAELYDKYVPYLNRVRLATAHPIKFKDNLPEDIKKSLYADLQEVDFEKGYIHPFAKVEISNSISEMGNYVETLLN